MKTLSVKKVCKFIRAIQLPVFQQTSSKTEQIFNIDAPIQTLPKARQTQAIESLA